MKILILANNSGGLHDFRGDIITALLKKHKVIASTPFDDKVPELKELGCQLIETPVDRRGMNPIRDIKLIYFYFNLIKRENPDLVLTYTVKPTIYGGMVCRMTKTKYISNITGLGTAVENPGMLRSVILGLYKIALKKVEFIFFQNRNNFDFFVEHRLFNARSRIIPGSGVNLNKHCYEEYPKTEPNEDKLLFIGRIMKDKGIVELLNASEKLHEKYPRVCIDIVGGSDENYADQMAEQERKKSIKYWGQQADIHSFLKVCNAVVLPSYHEGMANVLLEASSTGRPVLASNVPGCKETFDEGITGFGFEPRSAESLYRAMEHFISLDNETKSIMGKAARAKMEREFDRNIVVQAYMEEIAKLEPVAAKS